MTIISAVIKKEFIIVASDSLIVRKLIGKENKSFFPSTPKFVSFPQLRCIVSYWGNISIIPKEKTEPSWEIRKWLIEKLDKQHQFETIEAFGQSLTNELTTVFKIYNQNEYKMLGIHLIGFERFENKWIPELFLIIGDSNGWNFNFSRRTYGDLKNWENMDDDLTHQRLEYFNVLEKGYSVYNNGDNEMFNHFFNAFHQAIKSTNNRSQLSGGFSKDFFIDLATIPIKQVVYFQNKYYQKNNKSVGGKVHAVLMTFEGVIKELKSNKKLHI
jgi:hypothetical protein